jgi:hypothetical protein
MMCPGRSPSGQSPTSFHSWVGARGGSGWGFNPASIEAVSLSVNSRPLSDGSAPFVASSSRGSGVDSVSFSSGYRFVTFGPPYKRTCESYGFRDAAYVPDVLAGAASNPPKHTRVSYGIYYRRPNKSVTRAPLFLSLSGMRRSRRERLGIQSRIDRGEPLPELLIVTASGFNPASIEAVSLSVNSRPLSDGSAPFVASSSRGSGVDSVSFSSGYRFVTFGPPYKRTCESYGFRNAAYVPDVLAGAASNPPKHTRVSYGIYYRRPNKSVTRAPKFFLTLGARRLMYDKRRNT